MIQRIQSVFLLLVTALMVVVWFMPVGIFVGNFGLFRYALLELNNYLPLMHLDFPAWLLVALNIIIALCSLVTIFLYKNRKIQIILSIVGIVLLAFLYGAIFAYISTVNSYVSSVFHASFIMSLPGISMALYLLAIIFIKKDEKLVKSTDRIR